MTGVQTCALPIWYEAVSEHEGLKLKRVDVKRYAKVIEEKKAKETSYQIEMSDSLKAASAQEESAVWLYYSVAKVNNLKENKVPAGAASNSNAFQIERDAWRKVFSDPEFKPSLQNPLLLALQKAHSDNQLDAAIFVFFFEDSFRSEFEEWKKKHPLALQKFVERYALRPSFTKN